MIYSFQNVGDHWKCFPVECEPEHQISPSVFTKLLSDLSVKEGEHFTLSCKAEGNPLPTVQWFKDENCIDNNPSYQITYNNGEALLKVEHAVNTLNGRYTCVATNRLGSDSTASKVIVDGKYHVKTMTFSIFLSNRMVYITTYSAVFSPGNAPKKCSDVYCAFI